MCPIETKNGKTGDIALFFIPALPKIRAITSLIDFLIGIVIKYALISDRHEPNREPYQMYQSAVGVRQTVSKEGQ